MTLHPQARQEIERQAWELQELMPEALPAEVADALRKNLVEAGLGDFTVDELDEVREYAYQTIVNG